MDTVTLPCPLCGSSDRTLVASVPPLAAVRCGCCGAHYTAPRLSPEALRAFCADAYDLDYAAHYEQALGPVLQRRYRQTLAKLGTPDGELLDVGAYLGLFVRAARDAGWQVRGLETLRGAVLLAQHRGIPVAEGDVHTAVVADGSLAAVTLWDVLEHLEQPRAALQRLHGWLRPGGRLLIRVPDFASFLAAAPPAFALEYHRWLYPLDLNQHLLHFTEPDLRRLLAECGFAVDAVWDDGIPDAPHGAWPERAARALTAWGARRRGLRRELTLLARTT